MELTFEERMAYSELRIINNKIRRNKEIKRHIILLALGTILLITLSIFVFSLKGIASDGSTEPLYKYYKSIQIQEGDTLYELSKDCSVDTKAFISEVVFINSLENANDIKCGEYIVIPYYSARHS